MKTFIFTMAIATAMMGTCKKENSKEGSGTNIHADDKMLLVLSAPSVHDGYYKKAFQKIVDFQVAYAKEIIGKDNVVIVVDSDTKKYYKGKLPEDVLLEDEILDIWMRDFTTTNPENPAQFVYTWASMTQAESKEVQNSFSTFAKRYGISYAKTDLLIDGGNIVDNYGGRIITTTRFMEDNSLTYAEAKEELKKALHATEVAILEPDEPVLAHSDGMVSWVDENVLLVNDYSDKPAFRDKILNELRQSFPGVTIIETPVDYKTNAPGEWDGFESACGVNLNATVTYKNVYVPVFNMQHDKEALAVITANTSKNVVQINAEGVCPMGGSVRCLTWQVTGENAKKIIAAAEED